MSANLRKSYFCKEVVNNLPQIGMSDIIRQEVRGVVQMVQKRKPKEDIDE